MEIKKTSSPERLKELERKLQFNENFKYVTNRIHSANSLDEIIIELKDDILSLSDADRMTIYTINPVKNEIYSKYMVGGKPKDVVVPISSSSIAGYTAYSMEMVNIKDVYDQIALKKINPELKFDVSFDKKSGYKTKQVLAVPIKFENRIFGVIQLINKKGGDAFTKIDEENMQEVARVLGIAFRNQMRSQSTRFNYLIKQDIINEEELKQAMLLARKQNRDIISVLMNEYMVNKTDIGMSLGQFYGCRFIEYMDNVFIPRELAKGLSIAYLKKALWVPVSLVDGKATIIVDNPMDIKLNDIKEVFKAKSYEFLVALKEDVLKFIETLEKAEEDTKSPISVILDELGIKEEKPAEDQKIRIDENTGAIVRLTNRIIQEAYEKGASDIHIEPIRDDKITKVRFRIDGTCINHFEFPYNHNSALVSRLKIMANLKIDEKRLPQDGKIKFPLKNKKKPLELRVATVPTVGGESVVIRILAANKPIPLDALKLSKRNLKKFKELVTKPYGIILVVGPTGSGKTTTLHSALSLINTTDKKIWTAEDPVEITQRGLAQVEIKHQIRFDFARAMRAFLRADPDVIMIGEMRDHETASIGIEASLTGHLVFSTLHTNSAPETITRFIDMGLDPFNFADALLGVLAQRLVRTLCNHCKEAYHPDRAEFDALAGEYGREVFSELGIHFNNDLTLYRAKGCGACNKTGYRGRAGLHELLIGTKEIKKLIQKKAIMEQIRDNATKDGMRTLYQDGIAKIFMGITDINQVRRICMS